MISMLSILVSIVDLFLLALLLRLVLGYFHESIMKANISYYRKNARKFRKNREKKVKND